MRRAHLRRRQMGFFDKIKSAVNAVTGGAAKVSMEFSPPVAFAGDIVRVRITATSTGADIKGSGVFVDLKGVEEVRLKNGTVPNVQQDIAASRVLLEQSFAVSGAFGIGA